MVPTEDRLAASAHGPPATNPKAPLVFLNAFLETRRERNRLANSRSICKMPEIRAMDWSYFAWGSYRHLQRAVLAANCLGDPAGSPVADDHLGEVIQRFLPWNLEYRSETRPHICIHKGNVTFRLYEKPLDTSSWSLQDSLPSLFINRQQDFNTTNCHETGQSSEMLRWPRLRKTARTRGPASRQEGRLFMTAGLVNRGQQRHPPSCRLADQRKRSTT